MRKLSLSMRNNDSLTLIVASSLEETITLYTGWKTTLVTGALCADRQCRSGGRGIHSAGERLSLVGAPAINSLSASANFASRSIT